MDALCGLAVTSLGHSHPQIAETIARQSKELIHTSNAFNIDSQEKLAKRLCQLTGMDNAFFCNSGVLQNLLRQRLRLLESMVMIKTM